MKNGTVLQIILKTVLLCANLEPYIEQFVEPNLLKQKKKKTKAIELGRLSKNDHKKFWNKIKRKSKIDIGSCDFFEHFKTLCNNITNWGREAEKHLFEFEENAELIVNQELDREITMSELDHSIKHLKNGKATGYDNI